jgi:penicillin-binding protein 2
VSRRWPARPRLGRLVVLGLLLLAAACSTPASGTALPTPALTLETQTPPTALPSDYEGTAAGFLAAWQRGDYATMYSLLSPLSQAAITQEDFTKRYTDIADSMTQTSVETKILSSLADGPSAQISYEVTFHTGVVGDIRSIHPIVMPLVFDEGRWGISWTDGLILPQLEGGNTLLMDYSRPARANIYDRNDHGLAVETDAVALGIVPGQITDEDSLLGALSNLLGLRKDYIRDLYANAQPDWYVPVGEASADEVQNRLNYLSSLGGLQLTTIKTRYYPGQGIAPHVVGYTGFIPKERLAEYRAQGYRGDERVGVAGIEAWGEQYLAGKAGGTLNIYSPSGAYVGVLAESKPQPSQSITLTIDRDLQQYAQSALGDFNGAVVVMDPNTGAILAMASNPSFDPNIFDPTNPNSINLSTVINNNDRPLLNRATQGAYPPGSVFKIVTMAAALESGIFTPDARYTCTGYWSELGPGFVKEDWTVQFKVPPHGNITLAQALTVSCNPYFWHIGLTLGNADPNYLPNIARGFGLGPATGIGEVAEADGLIPDPDWKQSNIGESWVIGDSVNMATGQGYVLATPLQIARMIAAVANGGTLYRPNLVQEISPPGGPPTYTFTPEVVGRLPISPENLDVIRASMRNVTRRTDDKGAYTGGTAWGAFRGLSIPLAGKTGTAEDPGLPHSWFAGYTLKQDPTHPDLAIVVFVENIGEGSEYAAPIFRRIVEEYFFGRPYTLYPWESSFGVTAVPTDTPNPLATTEEGTPPAP